MSIARSTPRRAAVSESGRAMSPSTTSTFGSEARVCASAGFRTRARDGIPFAESRRTSSDPFSPVAPVTRIISAKVWNHAPSRLARPWPEGRQPPDHPCHRSHSRRTPRAGAQSTRINRPGGRVTD